MLAVIGENGDVRYGVSGDEVREMSVWVWWGLKTPMRSDLESTTKPLLFTSNMASRV